MKPVVKSLYPVLEENAKLYNIYTALQSSHWIPTEISYKDDCLGWSMLDYNIKMPLVKINAFFVNADSEITDIIEDKLRVHFKDNPQIQALYSCISSNEFVHNETYARYVFYVLEDEYKIPILTNQFHQSIDKMAWIKSKFTDNIATLLVIQVIIEGLFFNNLFSFVHWVDEYLHHKLPALFNINSFVMRDEGVHTNTSIELYNNFIPVKLSQAEIYSLFTEAIEVEYKFVESILVTELDILTLANLKDHIKHIANSQIVALGYPAMEKTQTVFTNMTKQSINNRVTDFFVDIVTDYKIPSSLDINEYSDF